MSNGLKLLSITLLHRMTRGREIVIRYQTTLLVVIGWMEILVVGQHENSHLEKQSLVSLVELEVSYNHQGQSFHIGASEHWDGGSGYRRVTRDSVGQRRLWVGTTCFVTHVVWLNAFCG